MSKKSNKAKYLQDQGARMADKDAVSSKKTPGEDCKRKQDESSNEDLQEREARVAENDAVSLKKASGEDCKRKHDYSSNEESSDNELPKMKPQAKALKTKKAFSDDEDTPPAFRNVKFDDASTSNRGSEEASAAQIYFMNILAKELKEKLSAIVPIDDSSKANASDWIKFAKAKLIIAPLFFADLW